MRRTLPLFFVLAFAAFMLVGCAAKEPTKISAPATDKMIKQLPSWFLEPPTTDKFIFAAGTATSRDIQLAKDKASQAARLEIAKSLETQFTSLTKRFQEEVGTELEAQYLDQFTQATKEVINTTLVGVTIDQTEMRNEEGVFRCYILVKLDLDRSNKMLLDKIRQQEQLYTRFRSTEVFQELESSTQPEPVVQPETGGGE